MTRIGFDTLFDLPRPRKRALQLLADIGLITVSFVLAMLLRTESLAFVADWRVWAALGAALPVTLAVFIKLGFYRAIIRYMGARALRTVIEGVATSAIALMLASYLFNLHVPAAVPFIYAVIAFCTVGGVRFAFRALFFRTQSRLKTRVIIYGAGQSGRQLLHSLMQGPDYAPVAFVDDNRELHGTQIGGLLVFSPNRLPRLIDDYGAKVILLAIPSADRATRAAIIARLEHLPVRVQMIPGMTDVVEGRARFLEVREVTVEDLLGRDPVPPQPQLMSATITGRTVLVTGAGGSIGSELCRQILRQDPAQLVLLELSEFALYRIEQELARQALKEGRRTRLVPLIGSVRDGERVGALLHQFGVQTIYHAAAYKHVPLVEQNMVAGVLNNVFGTLTIARAAAAAGVESFILISTDKAVRPTNVMGATKRMAELICQALAQGPSRTRFSMVRFGNVLGTSGSVIPKFSEQIAAGGPVTVTHPEIERYFMTVTEAAQLVIQAGALARGGDVFLLDMGRPVKIAELAKRMIRLSGFAPVVETASNARAPRAADTIPIVFTALRPGEKLSEELLVDDRAGATAHPRIMTATETRADWATLAPLLDRLAEACRSDDIPGIRAVFAEAPTGYLPADAIADLTWVARAPGAAVPLPAAPRPAAPPAASLRPEPASLRPEPAAVLVGSAAGS
jgi:FlaA1/EpsC-like NDP-sugar epimerase